MSFSLRRRAVAAYLVLASVVSFTLGSALLRYEQNRYTEDLKSGFGVYASLAAEQLRRPLLSGRIEYIRETTDILAGLMGARITVVRFDGTVISDSLANPDTMSNHAGRPEFALALRGQTGENIRSSTTLGQSMLYVAYPIRDAGGVVGAVRVARNTGEVFEALAHARRIFVLGVLLSGLLAGLVGWFFITRLLRPLEELRRAALKVSEGDSIARVSEPQESELADLARSFNHMSRLVGQRVEEIQNQRQQLEVILANLDVGIVAFDRFGRVILVNRAAEEILDIPDRTWQGRNALELSLDHRLAAMVEKALGGETVEEELTMRQPSGRVLRVSATPVRSGEEMMGGAIVVMGDLTRLRRLERIRSDFVANVSHELRTPLASIRAAAETLQDGAVTDEEAAPRFLQIIASESERLGNMVRDLLTLASAESPGLVLAREVVDAGSLIKEVVSGVRAAYSGGPIATIEAVVAPGVPPMLGERERLREALFNLVDNAVKYTPKDGLVVVSAAEKQDQIRLSVSDNGPGISQEHQSRLFERFYRVDKDRSRAVGGTGLGLAIVKHIAEAHGGRVGVESILGKGSTFWFTVPAASRKEHTAAEQGIDESGAGTRSE